MDNLELYHAARRAYWFGRYNRAVEICARADFHKCDSLRARILNPDEHYTKILARYHRRHKPRCYLEIGVEQGTTLRLSAAQTTVGVDPAPQCEEWSPRWIRAHAVYGMTTRSWSGNITKRPLLHGFDEFIRCAGAGSGREAADRETTVPRSHLYPQ